MLAAVLALGATAGVLAYRYFVPSNAMASAFEEDELHLVLQGEVDSSPNRPKIVGGEIMLPFETVKRYIDSNIYWDEALKKVTVTTGQKVIRMKTDSLEAVVNNKPLNLKIPVTTLDGVVYMPIEFLKGFYNIEIEHNQISNTVIIDFTTWERQLAEVAKPVHKRAVIRKAPNIKAPILRKFDVTSADPRELSLIVLESGEKWYKVRAVDGTIGYMEKKYILLKEQAAKKIEPEETSTTLWKPEKGKINLVWEMLYSKTDTSKREKTPGVDVISPTWFQLQNETGKLVNYADAKYVEWAHANGMKVWALLKNDGIPAETTGKFLRSTDARDNLIRELLAYSSLYKLDGINIDLENIRVADRDALTQFVREITPLLKEQGLVVSMDVGVPDGSDNWSLCYDRKALSAVVDYLVVMTYDQFWTGSPKAGSVAQAAWVEKYLAKSLETIPKEKLLLGIPAYTRIWEEKPDKDGKIKVTSKTVSMGVALKNARDNGATVVWDEVSGQFYTEYKKGDSTFKIWLEDDNSINIKASLVQKYDIAGAGLWSRNDADKSVYAVLEKALKGYTGYRGWLEENKDRSYFFK